MKSSAVIINPHPDTAGRLKAFVSATPVLGPVARTIARFPAVKDLRRLFGFQDSSTYWEKRYSKGGTSGSGSVGRLAEFKAEILNAFVESNHIQSVIEFGCGDGTQLALARYPCYFGVDIAEGSISACRERFKDDQTKSFYLASQLPPNLGLFDLVLSLDVIYHLVEDEVYESHMRSLFGLSGRFVGIYSSNRIERSDAPHVRHRLFTRWIELNASGWRQTHHVPNAYPYNPARADDTSFADFYFFETREG